MGKSINSAKAMETIKSRNNRVGPVIDSLILPYWDNVGFDEQEVLKAFEPYWDQMSAPDVTPPTEDHLEKLVNKALSFFPAVYEALGGEIRSRFYDGEHTLDGIRKFSGGWFYTDGDSHMEAIKYEGIYRCVENIERSGGDIKGHPCTVEQARYGWMYLRSMADTIKDVLLMGKLRHGPHDLVTAITCHAIVTGNRELDVSIIPHIVNLTVS